MKNNPLLSVDGLTVKYEHITALEHISFDVFQGDFIAVVGVNGSGKTTLAKSILGLLRIAEGKIHWQNDVQVGYLSQNRALEDRYFPATVTEIVSTGLFKEKSFPKWLNKSDKTKIMQTLKQFGIGDLAKKRIGELSGGQQQRTLLARSMVMNPNILILDEPTNALDQASRQRFLDLLHELNREQNLTVILITHDVASVESVINRVLYLEQRLVFDGSFEAFCETQPYSPYIHTHPTRYKTEGKSS